MKFYKAQSLANLAELLDCSYKGDPEFEISGLNEIHRIKKGELVFVDHPKYYETALKSNASAVLIDQEVEETYGKALLISKDVFNDFIKLINVFSPETLNKENIHPSADIHPSVFLSPGVVIGANVKIEADTVLMPNAVIYANTHIGKRVRIHANTSIGSDAFYYQNKSGRFNKFITCGNVVIEDEVEIGSNCSIDRGVTDNTRIGAGTKLDNHVHIGHDTVIGKSCLFAAQVGVAGCVEIGNNVTLWGQVGVAANISIGDGVTVYAQSGIIKDLEAGKTFFGSPADEAKSKFKEMALLKRMLNKQ